MKEAIQGFGIATAMEDSADMAMESYKATVQDGFTGDLQNAMNSVLVIENVISGLKDVLVRVDLRPARGNDPQCRLLKPIVTEDLVKVDGLASEMTTPKAIQIEALSEDHRGHVMSAKLARHKA